MQIAANSVRLLTGGNVIKQGDETPFLFQFYDEKGNEVDIQGATVLIKIANYKALILEKTAIVNEDNTISFALTQEDVTGHGTMRLEFHVTYSDTKKEIFPADGWQEIKITQSLDDVGQGSVSVVTVEAIKVEYQAQIDDFKTDVNTTLTEIETVKGNAETATQNAIAATESANTASASASSASSEATTQAGHAKTQGDYAKAQGDYVESKKPDIEKFTNEQTNLQTQLNDLTGGLTQDAEVIQARGGHAVLNDRLDTFTAQLAQSNRQTQTLTHGTQVINGEVGSPLKVEFYGITRTNLRGNKGNFENGTYATAGNGRTVSLDTIIKKHGNSSLKVSGNGSYIEAYYGAMLETCNFVAGKYYLIAFDIYTTVNKSMQIKIDGVAKTETPTTLNQWITKYVKYNPTSDNSNLLNVTQLLASGESFNIDGLRIFEINAETFNKIGVSLTDADVERMFPYVDSVQHVKNPVVKVEGGNILSATEDDWEIGTLSNGNPATSSANLRSKDFVRIVPSQQYARSVDSQYVISAIYFYDINKNYVSITGSATFTTPSNAHFLKVVLKRADAGNVELTEIRNAKPMLNLGSTAKPFVPKNSSFLYAETTLAGDSSKKDILSYNEDKRRWEKTKWWETDVVLDGSKPWELNATHTGYKLVRYLLGANGGFSEVVKYDGTPLKKFNPNTSWVSGDEQNLSSASNYLYITISDADATGYDLTTTAGIKQYFTDKNYFLTYQLANPVVEEVKVEGDLVINGQTQVTVGSGFTYTTDDEGKRTYTITPANERYKETCNITEVKATFAKNIRSSVDDMNTKLSDAVTDQSILKRQMLDVLIRLEALEGV